MNYSPPPSRPRPRHLRASLCALLLLPIACASATAKQDYTAQPPPAWVQPVAAPPARAKQTETADGGVRYLLFDRQTRVTNQGAEYYYHVVEQVASAADLEKLSQLQLDFEPSYQRLVIHHIRVLRDGATRDALRTSEIKVVQQEDELDQQLFNGTLSAVVFLDDMRAGDVIDYAYSVNGDNPVLGGRFADTVALSESAPVDLLRARLLWPSARKLYQRARNIDLQPVVNQLTDESEYVWERRDVPAEEAEDSTPAWFDATASVELSEFGSWAEVAAWAAPLYQTNSKLSPALAAQIEKWRGEFAAPQARLLAARRFVQDDVRYLGIELGPYSHTPTQPDKVFQRRFGDCKDKSLLLATMLNALGIEAHPALVNTQARRTLDARQPSPYAFDHVIVQAQLDGKIYWLDPTISYQRGTLSNIYTPEYERALVLKPDTQALTQIPLAPPQQPTTTVSEVYQIADFASPVALAVTTTYLGIDADAMRYRLAGESRAELGKDFLNYYADHDPSIEADGALQIKDDEQANELVITERYRISRFWKDATHYFLAGRIGEELTKPDVSRRALPLRVSYPLNVEQLIEIHLPHAQAVDTGAEVLEDEALRLSVSADAERDVVRLRYTLNAKQDAVAAQNVASHLALIERGRDLAAYELKQGAAAQGFGFGRLLNTLFVLALLGVALLLLYGWLKRRRADVRAQAAAAQAQTFLRAKPGAWPETAIRMSTETEIDRYLADVPCRSCGRRSCAPSERHGLIYDSQRLVRIQLECERCRNSQDFYFALAV